MLCLLNCTTMQNENRASCEVWNGKGLKNKNEEFMNMVFVDKNE